MIIVLLGKKKKWICLFVFWKDRQLEKTLRLCLIFRMTALVELTFWTTAELFIFATFQNTYFNMMHYLQREAFFAHISIAVQQNNLIYHTARSDLTRCKWIIENERKNVQMKLNIACLWKWPSSWARFGTTWELSKKIYNHALSILQ